LTTNTAWGGTIRMNAALVDRFGAPAMLDPEARAFPTPDALATAGPAALTDAGLGYRAPYVAEVAAAVAGGTLDLEGLRTSTLETEPLRRRLLEIKGVGGYAAANLLLLLGRTDYIPIDSWARKMVSQEWFDGAPVADLQVEEAFAEWGSWRGLCYWFWNWDE
jgi:N-glycosylase/DNA lyase